MINLPFIMGLIGAIVGLIIGILVFGEIASAIDCPGEGANADGTDDKNGTRILRVLEDGIDRLDGARHTAGHVLLLALCRLRRTGQPVVTCGRPKTRPAFFLH